MIIELSPSRLQYWYQAHSQIFELSKVSLGDTILLACILRADPELTGLTWELQGEYDLLNVVGVHGFKDRACLGLLNNLRWLPVQSSAA